MEDKRNECRQISEDLLSILACPKCKGEVALQDDELVCQKCGRHYGIEDGIPIMIAED
jgi:uncharacterized protein